MNTYFFLPMTIYLPELEQEHDASFPDIESALHDPDGLLAMGGDLTPKRLLLAYSHGIFPWYSNDDPILWWSPSIRGVFIPENYTPSKSLKKFFKKSGYSITINHATSDVISLCASTRPAEETWIMPEMIEAYQNLAKLGHCHSVEVWFNNELVGGLYGLQIGQVFCGESMFSIKTNASKIALWKFCEHFVAFGGKLIDCQMMNPHLESLGAIPMERPIFNERLQVFSAISVFESCYQPQSLSNG